MAFGSLLSTASNSAGSVTNPFAVSAGFTVNVGDLVVVVYSERTSATASSISDGLGNTYTALTGADAGNGTCKAWYSLITNAGTCTPSAATTASSNDVGIAAARFEGPFLASPLDKNPACNVTTTFPATGTLTQADELIVAYFGCGNGPGTTTWTGGFSGTVVGSSGTGANTAGASMGYLVVSSTSTVTPTASAGPTSSCVTGVATFMKGVQPLTAPLYTETDTFFTPTITTGSVDVSPSLYTETDTFFSPTIVIPLTAPLYTETDTFFSATITQGAAQLQPSLYAETDTFFSATVTRGSVDLSPSLYVETDTFFSATVSHRLTAALFVESDTFFSAIVGQGGTLQSLTASLFVESDAFFNPSVAATYSLTPNLYVDDDTFFTTVFSYHYIFTATNIVYVPFEDRLVRARGEDRTIVSLET